MLPRLPPKASPWLHVLHASCRSRQYKVTIRSTWAGRFDETFLQAAPRWQAQAENSPVAKCQERQSLLTSFFEELCNILNGKYSAARSLACIQWENAEIWDYLRSETFWTFANHWASPGPREDFADSAAVLISADSFFRPGLWPVRLAPKNSSVHSTLL